ncbi:hypothetical protein Pfo_010162 [Paulownia fortunei]|nr:hypothetical protein Pfo_010162 [Paulownia fortunei]
MLKDVIRNGDILSYEVYKGFLRMDGQTLVNLEIFNNNASSVKRLLRNWICHPLQDVEKMNNRLDLPHLERLLGLVKSSFQSSSVLLLALIGNKLLKQRIRLRIGMPMVMLLQKHGIMTTSLSEEVSLPMLNGSEGLDKSLAQFEAAMDSDFPNYQAETLSNLMELFVEKATQWSQMIRAINCIDNGGLPVPNDIHLGEGSSYFPGTLLLTGPNIGGKSTLLRATCLAVILAQVFCHLVEPVNCRLLFATHYHPLTKEFAAHPRTLKTSSQLDQKLVFLYRLASGACPEGYGMQIALMAGVPSSVIQTASKAGQVMKEMVGESLKSSEQRENFSALHEEWLKALISISKTAEVDFDNDAFDSLFCLWHEPTNIL